MICFKEFMVLTVQSTYLVFGGGGVSSPWNNSVIHWGWPGCFAIDSNWIVIVKYCFLKIESQTFHVQFENKLTMDRDYRFVPTWFHKDEEWSTTGIKNMLDRDIHFKWNWSHKDHLDSIFQRIYLNRMYRI